MKNKVLLIGAGVVALAVLAGAAIVAVLQQLSPSYPVEVSFCPAGAQKASLTVFHRSALDGSVERVSVPEVACDSAAMRTGVRSQQRSTYDLAKLPLTVVVAQGNGQEKVTELYRLPNAEGYLVRQAGIFGSRADRTWELFITDHAEQVPADQLPTVE